MGITHIVMVTAIIKSFLLLLLSPTTSSDSLFYSSNDRNVAQERFILLSCKRTIIIITQKKKQNQNHLFVKQVTVILHIIGKKGGRGANHQNVTFNLFENIDVDINICLQTTNLPTYLIPNIVFLNCVSNKKSQTIFMNWSIHPFVELPRGKAEYSLVDVQHADLWMWGSLT